MIRFVILLLLVLGLGTNTLQAEQALPPLQSGLTPQDEKTYQRIFALQEDGRWKQADRLIKTLKDPVLLGHVHAQRYLHPTKYRSRYKELRRWLLSYNDHPQAQRIYKLAQKRRPNNSLAPQRPTGRMVTGAGYDTTGFAEKQYNPRKRLSKAKAKKARTYYRQMRRYTRKGWTKSVKNLIRNKEVQSLLHQGQLDQGKVWLAAGYYADGRDQWAYDWANKAIKKSGKYLPTAHWVAALSSWRLDNLDKAAHHFTRVSTSQYSSDWMISAGAYWAARSYLRQGDAQNVNYWLTRAAHYPRTFYGLLAAHALGYDTVFDWSMPTISTDVLQALRQNPSAARGMALLALGQDEMAEKEFRRAYSKTTPAQRQTMLALAYHGNMPSFTLRLAGLMEKNGTSVPVSAFYPIPKWLDAQDFKVDRALIFALMRQESGFNPTAKSYAGARGLMQLMPATASFVARDRSYRHSKKLYQPETNIKLGQRYIQMLMAEDAIKGDLFHLTAAWNGGPGNLNKWKRRITHHNDPLLFIESLPAKETRIFVERVLTNFWIYRQKMNQDTPTLTALASGGWPTYVRQDRPSIEVAQQ